MIYIVHNTDYALNERVTTLVRANTSNVSDVEIKDVATPGSGITAAAWASGQNIMTLCDMYDGGMFSDTDAIIFVWNKDYGIKVANDLNIEHNVNTMILYAEEGPHNRLILSDGCLEYYLTDLTKYA